MTEKDQIESILKRKDLSLTEKMDLLADLYQLEGNQRTHFHALIADHLALSLAENVNDEQDKQERFFFVPEDLPPDYANQRSQMATILPFRKPSKIYSQ